MKKIILGLFVMLAALVLGTKVLTVKAAVTVTMTEGASMRLDDPAGLRFKATVSEAVAGAKYGIVFANGEVVADQVVVGATGVVNAEVGEVNADGTYSVSMVNIPSRAYFSDITARAYIYANGSYTYSENVVTRHINEVAKAYKKAHPDVENELVKDVLSYVKLNLNAGVCNDLNVIKTNLANDTALTSISTNANSGFWGGYASSIFLFPSASTIAAKFSHRVELTVRADGLYEVTQVVVSGGTYTASEGATYTILISENYSDYAGTADFRSTAVVGTIAAIDGTPSTGVADIKFYSASTIETAKSNDSTISVTYPYTLPTNVEKTGYIFKGWYNNPEFSGSVLTTISESTNLYAKWEKDVNTYTISYELNDGFFPYIYQSHTEIVADFVVDFNKHTGRVVASDGSDFFDRSWNASGESYGYLFLTSEAYSAKWSWMLDLINADRIARGANALSASDGQAEARGEIHTFLNLCGTSGTAGYGTDRTGLTFEEYASKYVPHVEYPTKYVVGNEVSLVSPIKDGYEFSGWYDNPEFSGSAIQKIDVNATGNIILYAKWNALENLDEYTINYVLDGGTLPTGTKTTYTIEDSFTLTIPSKDGYIFDGWYLDSAFSGESITAIALGTTGNLTLYAKWISANSEWANDLELLFANPIESDITLPTTYEEYTLVWNSSDETLLSNQGIYTRPYQDTRITMSVDLVSGSTVIDTATFTADIKGYADLSQPFAAGFIWGNLTSLTEEVFTNLDVLYCAFIKVDSNGNFPTSYANNLFTSNLTNYVIDQAHGKGKWVVLSVTGVDGAATNFEAIAASATARTNFANNIVTIINQYHLDGVDIDWETPSSSTSTNFTLLMKEIYTKVKANNINHLVTADIGGGKWQPPKYDLNNSQQYMDYINVMTYGGASSYGYHQSALYKSTTKQPYNEYNNYYQKASGSADNGMTYTLTSCSVDETVTIFHNTYKVPYNKLAIGAAFYGIRQVSITDDSGRTYFSQDKTTETMDQSYTTILTEIASGNYDEYFDEECKVPYLLAKDKKTFYSYDNPTSIGYKCDYAKEKGLASVFFWASRWDHEDILVKALGSSIK